MEESHTLNCERLQALDYKCRSLYSSGVGLVNDGMEAIRGYGWLVSALNIWQQAILRKSGPFIEATTSKSSKPKNIAISSAVSLTADAAKKKRSRDSSRKA